MKKLKFLFSCALLCMSFGAKAQIVKMTIEDMVIDKGETSEMVVSLENSMNIVAWQMYLYLPEGIIPYYDEDEDDYLYQLSKRHGKRHSFGITPTTDGSYLIKCYADPVQNIKDNNGELFRLSLSASNTKMQEATLLNLKRLL